jgi:hypothetical protein
MVAPSLLHEKVAYFDRIIAAHYSSILNITNEEVFTPFEAFSVNQLKPSKEYNDRDHHQQHQQHICVPKTSDMGSTTTGVSTSEWICPHCERCFTSVFKSLSSKRHDNKCEFISEFERFHFHMKEQMKLLSTSEDNSSSGGGGNDNVLLKSVQEIETSRFKLLARNKFSECWSKNPPPLMICPLPKHPSTTTIPLVTVPLSSSSSSLTSTTVSKENELSPSVTLLKESVLKFGYADSSIDPTTSDIWTCLEAVG